MQDTAPSPAPSRSGPYRGPEAAAIATVAQRAEADAASVSEAEKSQDAEISIQRDTKKAHGHRIWGGPGKKDIVATSISALQAFSIHKPSGVEEAQHKMGSHLTPTVTNQVKHPMYSHPVKTTRLGYIRHALGMIPESEPQQELWASKPMLNISSVPVQKNYASVSYQNQCQYQLCQPEPLAHRANKTGLQKQIANTRLLEK